MQVAFRVPDYKENTVGDKGTEAFRSYLSLDDSKLSPWHDLDLVAGKSETGDYVFNFVNEITRGESFKFEMSKEEKGNPVKHDMKNGQIRVLKYHAMTFNYGFFPQTWENPDEIDPLTNLKGDGDPLDVVEIGIFPQRIAGVAFVKVIGAIGLIDEGETDWKVIAIDVNDPKAHYINGIDDLKKHKIGALEAITDFFINYKTVDGKQKNLLWENGKFLDQQRTLDLIFRLNLAYKENLAKLQKLEKE